MNGKELLRKLKRLGKNRNVKVTVKNVGKGSHRSIYYGNICTRIPNLKDDLKSGTLAGILRQLGLTLSDL